MMLSKWKYYLTSIPTLLFGIKNLLACAWLPFRREPIILRLRNGLQFKVRTLMDVWIIKETCLDRDYEKHGARVEDGWRIIDVGAALGDYIIMTARECPSSWVIAYEPSPASFALLQENLALNNIKNVHAFPYAISSINGVLKLSTCGEAVQHTTSQTVSEEDTVEVRAIRLEDVFRSTGFNRCHFLKMDCEGGEFDILLNTPLEILDRIDRICLEYHDGFTEFSHTDLVNHLRHNGYRVKISRNPVHHNLGFLYAYKESNTIPVSSIPS